MAINRFVPALRALLVAGSFLVSSVLIHLAVMDGGPLIVWLALCSLVFVPFSIGMVRLRWRAWLGFTVACAALAWLVATVGGRPLLYAPSVMIPAALCWFFGRTL